MRAGGVATHNAIHLLPTYQFKIRAKRSLVPPLWGALKGSVKICSRVHFPSRLPEFEIASPFAPTGARLRRNRFKNRL